MLSDVWNNILPSGAQDYGQAAQSWDDYMGGAAAGSGIKGEEATNSVISTGLGSVAGSLGGKVVDSLSPVTDEVIEDLIGTVTGSSASGLTGKAVKDELDKREKKQ